MLLNNHCKAPLLLEWLYYNLNIKLFLINVYNINFFLKKMKFNEPNIYKLRLVLIGKNCEPIKTIVGLNK